MKINTSELTGAALDWAVARCEGGVGGNQLLGAWYAPSTNWSQGGPIIERAHIGLWSEGYDWEAKINSSGQWLAEWDEYPLIAAMRCYVASKMGDEVEIPEELTK